MKVNTDRVNTSVVMDAGKRGKNDNIQVQV